jgi:sugar phosphate isomerase/epimerase
MRENSLDSSDSGVRQARTLGYALNVFPYDTLAELWACLENEVLQIKERAFPEEAFPIELRFSERIVRELSSDCDAVARLKYFLDTHDLALITVNGFVMPAFHGERVKERVYLPAWHESDARLRFTNSCVDLLVQLAPLDAEFVSVSAPFGALKPVTMDAIAPNILKAAEHAAKVQQRTGVRVAVALEPEPGLTGETTAEVVEFFERFVPEPMRQHLAVNFDLSHQLVQFERLDESFAALAQHNVPVAKVHVSNAAEMATLRRFCEDSIYLHQVCGVNARGERVYFSLDWPTSPAPSDVAKFRVHYHLPVFPTDISTTLDEVAEFLANAPRVLLIIETYTWPEQLRGAEKLVENVCRELAWVRERICLSGK